MAVHHRALHKRRLYHPYLANLRSLYLANLRRNRDYFIWLRNYLTYNDVD